MASNYYPPAPFAPPPFPNASLQMPQGLGQGQPAPNRFGPLVNGPPTAQFAGLQIDPNAQRNQQVPASGQYGKGAEVPTRYEGVTLRKDPNPPFGAEPSWSRVKVTPIAVSNEELIKTVNKRGKDNVQKDMKKLKSEKQRAQIDQLVGGKRAHEPHPNADWILASVEEERGQGKRPYDTETKAIHVIMKRQQKTKPSGGNNNNARARKNSAPQADIPGFVQELNMPRRQSEIHQAPLPPFPRGPYQQSMQPPGGPMGQQGGPNAHSSGFGGGGLPPQSFPPPPPNQTAGPMNPQKNHINTAFQPSQPPMQPMQQNKQFDQPFPPPPPAAIPIPIGGRGGAGQQDRQPDRKSQDDIVHIIQESPPRSKPRKSSFAGGSMGNSMRPGIHSHRNSNVSFTTSSDDDDSPTSEDFTNITTPTSGTGSLPRQQRRHSGIDYLTGISEKASLDRRGSRSRRFSRGSQDLVDDYIELRPQSSSGKGREARGYMSQRPLYEERSTSDALYKPQRRLTPTQELKQEYLLGLERIRQEENAKLDRTIRGRELYERDRDRYDRRYRSPPRYDRHHDLSPSRHRGRHY